MGLSLQSKQQLVKEVAQVAAGSSALLGADFSGLNVAAMTELRAQARKSDVYLKVVKNTLLIRAVEGTKYATIRESVRGPLLLAFSGEEPGSAARLFRDFQKSHEAFEIRVIALDGRLLDPQALDMVASLPSRDEALARLMATTKAPVTKLVQTLAAPQLKLVRTLAAIRDQKRE